MAAKANWLRLTSSILRRRRQAPAASLTTLLGSCVLEHILLSYKRHFLTTASMTYDLLRYHSAVLQVSEYLGHPARAQHWQRACNQVMILSINPEISFCDSKLRSCILSTSSPAGLVHPRTTVRLGKHATSLKFPIRIEPYKVRENRGEGIRSLHSSHHPFSPHS